MFIHVTPKQINNIKEWPVVATFEYQHVKFEERYKSVSTLKNAIRRMKRYQFHNAVDFKEGKVYRMKDLFS